MASDEGTAGDRPDDQLAQVQRVAERQPPQGLQRHTVDRPAEDLDEQPADHGFVEGFEVEVSALVGGEQGADGVGDHGAGSVGRHGAEPAAVEQQADERDGRLVEMLQVVEYGDDRSVGRGQVELGPSDAEQIDRAAAGVTGVRADRDEVGDRPERHAVQGRCRGDDRPDGAAFAGSVQRLGRHPTLAHPGRTVDHRDPRSRAHEGCGRALDRFVATDERPGSGPAGVASPSVRREVHCDQATPSCRRAKAVWRATPLAMHASSKNTLVEWFGAAPARSCSSGVAPRNTIAPGTCWST